MTARTYRLAYSAWVALGGSPLASAWEVIQWWRG